MTNEGACEVLRFILNRPELMEVLRSGTFDRHDIESGLDVSRSTAHRVVHTLRDQGMIHRREGTYVTTPFGDLVIDEANRSTSRLEMARRLQPLLRSTKAQGFEPELEAFTDAHIVCPSDSDQEIEALFVELVEDADVVQSLTKSVIGHRFLGTVFDRILSDSRVDVVTTADMLEFVLSTHPAAADLPEDPENVDLSIVDGVPLHVTIADDDRACIGVYNDGDLRFDRVIETSNPAAITWAQDVLDACKNNARPYECNEPPQ